MTPALIPWYTRYLASAQTWARQAIQSITVLRRPPPPPGITSGRVVSPRFAEKDLEALAKSPTVYAAVTARCLSLCTFPIRCYQGFGTSTGLEPLEPDSVQWVGALLRLLQLPDPSDQDALFPKNPGEALMAQILADLILTGNFFVAVTSGPSGDVIGLARLHPQAMVLERYQGADYWVYRQPSSITRYPRNTVAHGKLLSWQNSAGAEIGVGAGSPLRELVRAEEAALAQTADVVEQGGADVMVTGKDASSIGFLQNKANRDQVVQDVSTALSGDKGRRVFVVGGNLDVKDSGLKPADVRAPELLVTAANAELRALGTVPITVGADSGTYATAVQQSRQQAIQDDAIVNVVESALLRPLARHFARRAGGRWAMRTDRVTCRIDLSTHSGYSYQRTDTLARMVTLVQLGWTPEQASEVEGLDLPKPEGQPMQMQAGPPAAQSSEPGAPRRPLGEQAAPPPRRLTDLFTRSEGDQSQLPPYPSQEIAQERIDLWQRADKKRTRSDQDLESAAQRTLNKDLGRCLAALMPKLQSAHSEDGYGPVDLEAVGPAPDLYTEGMGSDWLKSWEEACSNALEGIANAEAVSVPSSTPATLEPLSESSRDMANTSWEAVRQCVRQGMDNGDSPNDIQKAIQQLTAFSPERALRIARTETVRAQSGGANARYQTAKEEGLEIVVEWMAGSWSPTQRPEHRALDGQRVIPGGRFQFSDGTRTQGPGMSGDPSHDCNCRCATRPVLRE